MAINSGKGIFVISEWLRIMGNFLFLAKANL